MSFLTAVRAFKAAVLTLVMVLVWPSPAAGQDLFVVSQATQQVLRYDGSTGGSLGAFVTPISDGFQVPGGVDIRPSDGTLYTSSTATGEFWAYTTTTGQVITPAVKTGLLSPGGIAFESTGADLYFLSADTVLSTGTDAVKRMVVSSGNVSTIATDATANFNFIAVNGADLFVSDTFNNQVARYPISGGGGGPEITGLSSPAGILFLSATEMLVANTGTDEVYKYTFNGSNWILSQTVLASTAGVDGPVGLALAPGGDLTVAGQFSNNVVTVNLSTLAVSTLVSAGAGGLSTPRDVVWDGSTLLVSSLSTNAIIYYDVAGNPTGTLARGISTPSDSGMVFAANGNLFVGSLPDNDVVEYSGQTGTDVRKFFDACPTSLASPFDQVIGPDGNLYISCPSSTGIFRFDPAGNPLGFFITGVQGLTNPQGLAFGPNGNLFVAEGFFDFNIKEFNGTTGDFVGVFVDSNGNTGVNPISPWDLTFHNGNLFVSSRGFDEVMEFNGTTGAFVQTFVTAGSGGLDDPTGLEFGPDGNLYVASFNTDSVKRFNGNTGSYIDDFVTTGSGGLDDPIDLGFQPAQVGGGVPALSREGVVLFMFVMALLGARWRQKQSNREKSR